MKTNSPRAWLDGALQDIAYALRGLRRQPRFSLVAIATLGIAIGVNASVFTALNSVFLRPWPVADPATLFDITTIRDGRPSSSSFSADEYRSLVESLSSMRGVRGLLGLACTDGFSPGCDIWLGDAILRPAYVSANALPLLGVPMERGRAFAAEEDQSGAPRAVAILGYDAWQRRFAGDTAIVGKVIRLDGLPFTVVGVAARTFAGTSILRTDVWLPLASVPLVRTRDAGAHLNSLHLVARLASGASAADARTEIETAIRRIRAQQNRPGQDRTTTFVRLGGTSLDPNPSKHRQGLTLFGVLLFGSALVILLACANLSNLYLARAAARGREIAIRVSIGASRGRVVRQLLTESLVTAIIAGVAGVAMAFGLSSYLLSQLAQTELSTRPTPDLAVLAYAGVISLLTCIAFGLAPALHATRQVNVSLKDAGGTGTSAGLRRVFLAVQVAVSVAVLSGAGALIRGASKASAHDYGFSVTGVQAVQVSVPASQDSAGVSALARELLTDFLGGADQRLIGAASALPFGGREQSLVLKSGDDSASGQWVESRAVSPGYFTVLQIPLTAGRGYTPGDPGQRGLLVNEALARRLWPGQNAVGQVLTLRAAREVIGVVRDADTEGSATRDGTVRPKVYEMFDPASVRAMPQFVVRGGAMEAQRTIGEIVRRRAPAARVLAEPVSEGLGRMLNESRNLAVVVGLFGAVALALVSIGIFGVFAYVVQQRTTEIAVRIALGATARDVVRVVVGSSGTPILIGLGAGFAAALAETQLARAWFYGISPLDPVTWALVVAMLGMAAIAAVVVPARRATRIAPIVALRAGDGG